MKVYVPNHNPELYLASLKYSMGQSSLVLSPIVSWRMADPSERNPAAFPVVSAYHQLCKVQNRESGHAIFNAVDESWIDGNGNAGTGREALEGHLLELMDMSSIPVFQRPDLKLVERKH